MYETIALGTCHACQVERELKPIGTGDYACKVCGADHQQPTHVKLIDTTEYGHE